MKFSLLFLALIMHVVSSTAQIHLKKDGTPDRRYKENRTSSSYHYKPSTSTYRSNTTYRSSSTHKTSTTHNSGGHRSTYVYGVKRDKNGHILRSESAKREFMKRTGYPHGRPGYVVDHIIPLKRGGCDCPSNMQWQTKEAAKEKDKHER